MPISRESTPEELVQYLKENNIILPDGAKASITEACGIMIIGHSRCGNIEHVDNIQIVDKDGKIIDNLWTCLACERPFPSADKTKDECCSEACRRYKSTDSRQNFYSMTCDFCKDNFFHGDISIILDQDNGTMLSCDTCLESHPPKRILIDAYENNDEPGILDDDYEDYIESSRSWNKINDFDNDDNVPNYHHDDDYEEYVRRSRPWSKFNDSDNDEENYGSQPLFKSNREYFGSNDYFNDR